MDHYLALGIGLVLAGAGGELFVRGLVGLARWARVPAGIVGATVAAFATSSPELSVSVAAALDGKPQIGLGDALGSNVVNVGLVLGLALVMSNIVASRDSIRRDFPIAVLGPFLTSLLIVDGWLSRFDGFVMLGVFLVWLAAATVEARRRRSAAKDVLGERSRPLVVLSCLGGLAVLVAAGRLIVLGAKGVGEAFAMDPFVVGATLVAVGTSVPELATTIVARLRGHHEVALGTILGSNIFNGFFIVAVAAIIHPIEIAWHAVVVALGFGVLVILLTIPGRGGLVPRRRGLALLTLYVAYVVTVLQLGTPAGALE